jgi:hypothetical protein
MITDKEAIDLIGLACKELSRVRQVDVKLIHSLEFGETADCKMIEIRCGDFVFFRDVIKKTEPYEYCLKRLVFAGLANIHKYK